MIEKIKLLDIQTQAAIVSHIQEVGGCVLPVGETPEWFIPLIPQLPIMVRYKLILLMVLLDFNYLMRCTANVLI